MIEKLIFGLSKEYAPGLFGAFKLEPSFNYRKRRNFRKIACIKNVG